MTEPPNRLANILAGIEDDGLVYDSGNILARIPKENVLSALLRRGAEALPGNPDATFSALNMIKGGLGSAANWLAGTHDLNAIPGPQRDFGRGAFDGEGYGDTLAPLGLAAMGTSAMVPFARAPYRGPVPMPEPSGVKSAASSSPFTRDQISKQVGPHKLDIYFTHHPESPGTRALEFTVDGSLKRSDGGVDPEHWPTLMHAVRQGVDEYIATHKPKALNFLEFDDIGGGAAKGAAWEAWGRSLAKKHGGEFDPDSDLGMLVTLPADSSRASVPGVIVGGMDQGKGAAAAALEKVTPAETQGPLIEILKKYGLANILAGEDHE